MSLIIPALLYAIGTPAGCAAISSVIAVTPHVVTGVIAGLVILHSLGE
ncbi:hypothetical protein [Alicyclobacillus dauci]|uniref:Uncharacterized protein n=1 Tax=Alicyclobacillus dauci TaxID=1475485 RepID=A0ABY6Z6X1_9BACL|nr:hypothetical protein [Alicyclobacillus dauci]WAH38637.1 hypothetical protein NZD86_09205 [Alicyclobacillus dauci]